MVETYVYAHVKRWRDIFINTITRLEIIESIYFSIVNQWLYDNEDRA